MTTTTKTTDVDALRAERARLADDSTALDREWKALGHDPAACLRRPVVAARIEAARRELAALDADIGRAVELAALVESLIAQFETEAADLAAEAAAVVAPIPDDDVIRRLDVHRRQLASFAAELSALTGTRIRPPDPTATLLDTLDDRRHFIVNRLAPAGHKPAVPPIPQRAQLDRARQLARGRDS